MTKRITISLPENLHKWLDDYANKNGYKVSMVVKMALEKWKDKK